jgi:hypothetical protein
VFCSLFVVVASSLSHPPDLSDHGPRRLTERLSHPPSRTCRVCLPTAYVTERGRVDGGCLLVLYGGAALVFAEWKHAHSVSTPADLIPYDRFSRTTPFLFILFPGTRRIGRWEPLRCAGRRRCSFGGVIGGGSGHEWGGSRQTERPRAAAPRLGRSRSLRHGTTRASVFS